MTRSITGQHHAAMLTGLSLFAFTITGLVGAILIIWWWNDHDDA